MSNGERTRDVAKEQEIKTTFKWHLDDKHFTLDPKQKVNVKDMLGNDVPMSVYTNGKDRIGIVEQYAGTPQARTLVFCNDEIDKGIKSRAIANDEIGILQSGFHLSLDLLC